MGYSYAEIIFTNHIIFINHDIYIYMDFTNPWDIFHKDLFMGYEWDLYFDFHGILMMSD